MTTPFTIDDLALSLRGNHIDEDSINLKALQAQLAETLFSHPANSQHRNGVSCTTNVAHEGMQPCNTPTSSRTPSSPSFSWGSPDPSPSYSPGRRRRPSESVSMKVDTTGTFENATAASTPHQHYHHHHFQHASFEEDDLRDEEMVEDLLLESLSETPHNPSVPSSRRRPSVGNPCMPSLVPSTLHSHINPHVNHESISATPSSATSSSSLFTTHDPFYVQLATQSAFSQSTRTSSLYGGSSSVFTQAGMPCHQSPFLLGQPFGATLGGTIGTATGRRRSKESLSASSPSFSPTVASSHPIFSSHPSTAFPASTGVSQP